MHLDPYLYVPSLVDGPLGRGAGGHGDAGCSDVSVGCHGVTFWGMVGGNCHQGKGNLVAWAKADMTGRGISPIPPFHVSTTHATVFLPPGHIDAHGL